MDKKVIMVSIVVIGALSALAMVQGESNLAGVGLGGIVGFLSNNALENKDLI